jgi:hypothetical protein
MYLSREIKLRETFKTTELRDFRHLKIYKKPLEWARVSEPSGGHRPRGIKVKAQAFPKAIERRPVFDSGR